MAIKMEKLVEEWLAAWNSHDPDRIARCYADDGIFEAVPRGMVARGTNEIKAAAKVYFTDYPDQKAERKTTFYSKNAVCGEVVFSGTQAHNSLNPTLPATGKHFSVLGGFISEWENGKVKTARILY